MRALRTLSSRQWLGVIWAAYALLPGVMLLIGVGVGALVWPGQSATEIMNTHPLLIALPVVTQLSVPIVVVIFVGWAVLKPLRAMSDAAGKVGKHDLDFSLPSSRVREINEAMTAFTVMGEELRAALARQAELEQERQFYISAIAHDLNSPIFALRGYLEGLESGIATTPERARHYLQACQAKVTELQHLTADLSAYTQIERLEQTMRREPLDLDALLEDAVESVRPQIEAKEQALTVEPPRSAPTCLIVGDPHLLQRAFTNVLENAARYTPVGGRISVTWGIEDIEGGQWRFAVADSGPGIAPEDLPHLFAPFYRGEASRNRATGGAGLGLAIAQRIMRAHGGTLTAANGPTSGAIFTGTMPVTSLAPVV
ncbi:MAG TPA: HAMP domain-containing sensor histidine kinase [Ktedonobacterales bacterium]|jgi:signal transduction histidine kinase|nr:HAMP domain-containing sensor histidine kinase [Ktedonobacterales bacterium]